MLSPGRDFCFHQNTSSGRGEDIMNLTPRGLERSSDWGVERHQEVEAAAARCWQAKKERTSGEKRDKRLLHRRSTNYGNYSSKTSPPERRSAARSEANLYEGTSL